MDLEQVCLHALKEAAVNLGSGYLKQLVEGMRAFRAVFRKGLCYAALVVERNGTANLVLIKYALNGYVKRAFEVPVDVAEGHLRAGLEALSAYRGGGGAGGGAGGEA